MEPKRIIYTLSTISLIFGLIVIAVGLASFNDFVYSKILYSVVGAIIALFSLVLIIRSSFTDNLKRVGEYSVAYGWWIFSGGIGGLIVYLAPLFNKGHPGASASLLISSTISIIIGIVLLGYAKNRLGAPLSV